MAKTVQEKLVSLLESAATLKDGATENYAQESIDRLTAAIDAAHNVSVDENATEEQSAEALKGLTEAVKAFKDPANIAPEPEKVSLKGVVLKGTESQKTGLHTLHLGRMQVAFKDGKAEVPADVARALIDGGYAEKGE